MRRRELEGVGMEGGWMGSLQRRLGFKVESFKRDIRAGELTKEHVGEKPTVHVEVGRWVGSLCDQLICEKFGFDPPSRVTRGCTKVMKE